jgi:hypothetical protein
MSGWGHGRRFESAQPLLLLPNSRHLIAAQYPSLRANSRYSIWESGQLRLETQPTGDNFERFTGHVQVIHRGSLIFIAARHSAGDHFIGP